MTEIEEKLIIDRCKRGEQAAFDILIRAYEKRVYNLAYRLSGNYDDANDISVDAFVRIYQAIKLFRGEANFFNMAVSNRDQYLPRPPQTRPQQAAPFP